MVFQVTGWLCTPGDVLARAPQAVPQHREQATAHHAHGCGRVSTGGRPSLSPSLQTVEVIQGSGNPKCASDRTESHCPFQSISILQSCLPLNSGSAIHTLPRSSDGNTNWILAMNKACLFMLLHHIQIQQGETRNMVQGTKQWKLLRPAINSLSDFRHFSHLQKLMNKLWISNQPEWSYFTIKIEQYLIHCQCQDTFKSMKEKSKSNC